MKRMKTLNIELNLFFLLYMGKCCSKNKIEYRNIPQVHSPRASFTAFLYSLLRVLSPVLPVKELDILNSISYISLWFRHRSIRNFPPGATF